VELLETQRRERAILVGVAQTMSPRSQVEEYLDELAFLAESVGAEVVDRTIQERRGIDAAFFVGKGKAQEIAAKVSDRRADIVLFDDDLSSVQVRNLERVIPCKILDRSGLILDTFASRARTSEAKTQVELAQLQYLLPRLTRRWTHLSKQFGGIGTKGPGETQIETDRRAIRRRISRLNEKLTRISKERAEQRKGRDSFFRMALVGYTNAGKSSLMNLFSGAGVVVEDRMFATLDSTVRLARLSPAHTLLLSDTVGFIRKLPHNLIASFKSTLDEVREADALLHVVDVSHPLFEEHIAVAQDTLEEIGIHDTPTIMVFNKIDRLEDRSIAQTMSRLHPEAVCISATRGINLGALRDLMIRLMEANISEQTMTFGHDDYPLISQIYNVAEILDTRYEEDSVTIRFRLPRQDMDRLRKVLIRKPGGGATARPS
jgi:GTPase